MSNRPIRQSPGEYIGEQGESLAVAVTPEETLPALSPEKKTTKNNKKIDVAEVVVQYSEERAKKLKEEIEEKKQTQQTVEKIIQENQKKLRTLNDNTESLEEKYNSLTQTKRSELVDRYRKIVTLLKQHPMVGKFEVDIEKRIIITTKPIFVKVKYWRSSKEAGVYQIRIDFSKKDISQAIQILNITKRLDSNYDSPTIMSTKPCWGNIAEDIKKDFQTQDLYELVVDLIDYIGSPNVSYGYLSENGDNSRGWHIFMKKATTLPKGYCFEKYDQDSKNVPGVAVDPTTLAVNVEPRITDSMATWTYQQSEATAGAYIPISQLERMAEEQAGSIDVNRDEREIIRFLTDHIDLQNHAAYYITRMFFGDLTNHFRSRNANILLRQIEVSNLGSPILIHFRVQQQSDMRVRSINEGETMPEENISERVFRYYLNPGDSGPRLSESLARRHIFHALYNGPPLFSSREERRRHMQDHIDNLRTQVMAASDYRTYPWQTDFGGVDIPTTAQGQVEVQPQVSAMQEDQRTTAPTTNELNISYEDSRVTRLTAEEIRRRFLEGMAPEDQSNT